MARAFQSNAFQYDAFQTGVVTGTAEFTDSGESFACQGVAGQSLKHKQRGYAKVIGEARFTEGGASFSARGFVVIRGSMTVEQVIGEMNGRGFVTEGDEELISLLQLLAEM